MSTDAPLRVHWLRHGEVASHRGDTPVTEQGKRQIELAAQRFAEKLVPSEIVTILHAPTRRTQETAFILYDTLKHMLDATRRSRVQVLAPVAQGAIRNPDIYVAGTRIELVSSPEAVVDQLPQDVLGIEQVAQLPFLRGFLSASDRVGYWVSHADPPGEDADTVARRLLTFARSLLDLPRSQSRRYICVTHSPPMRAFLRCYLLDSDPGEPAYGEAVDLEFEDNGSCHVQYRQIAGTIA